MITSILGAMFVFVGIYMVAKPVLAKKNGFLTEGTVLGYVQREGHMFANISIMYKNEELHLLSSTAHKKPKYSEGDKVEVYYVEKDECVYIKDDNSQIKNGLCIFVLGAAILVIMILR